MSMALTSATPPSRSCRFLFRMNDPIYLGSTERLASKLLVAIGIFISFFWQ